MARHIVHTFSPMRSKVSHPMVEISAQQKSVLERNQFNNNHTKVRLRLAELFHLPSSYVKNFKEIEKQEKN